MVTRPTHTLAMKILRLVVGHLQFLAHRESFRHHSHFTLSSRWSIHSLYHRRSTTSSLITTKLLPLSFTHSPTGSQLSTKRLMTKTILVKKAHSSFQKAAGNATSARTTTSRAERSVIDVRRPRALMTSKASLNTCLSPKSKSTRKSQRS